MDGRKNNGGAREGAGRKPKADEEKLQLKLSELDEVAFSKLKEGVNENSFPHIKLWFEYRFGKPKQQIDHTNDGGGFHTIPDIVVYNTAPPLAKSEDEITDVATDV